MTEQFNKIFGLGLSRTGTSSLNEALNILGIPSTHYPHDPQTQIELFSGKGQITLLDQYTATTDISTIPFYKTLDKNYPNSKFILTLRDAEPWVVSLKDHLSRLQTYRDDYDDQFWSFTRAICRMVYGSMSFDRERLLTVFHNHNRDVKAYFKHRPNDLLCIDITKGAQWGPICEFLGLAAPSQPFPYENKRPD